MQGEDMFHPNEEIERTAPPPEPERTEPILVPRT